MCCEFLCVRLFNSCVPGASGPPPPPPTPPLPTRGGLRSLLPLTQMRVIASSSSSTQFSDAARCTPPPPRGRPWRRPSEGSKQGLVCQVLAARLPFRC